jgi:hypothetical protein
MLVSTKQINESLPDLPTAPTGFDSRHRLKSLNTRGLYRYKTAISAKSELASEFGVHLPPVRLPLRN